MSVRCQIGPESRDGNWIVIQRRDKGKETFFRGWDDYKNGFGDLKTEFFYGLEKIHRMTNHELMQLGFIFKRRSSSEYWQIVKQFEISDENSNYKIVECNQEYGKFPHQFVHHLNYEFSTYDRKNDNHDKENCALTYRSGWWFHKCFRVNLNAIYKKSSNKNIPNCIRWAGIEECLEFTMMMLRPSPN
ncbi:uncharacterized protein Dwil_GK11636 [Drosophila willistoni]|uniref:Fibrinogen C-terminal domain-containing protein n=1 Tax=Drosophila willistoni TaxID=7260 RepID=B4N9S4_DROWI|nr:uncharacterized protein Dwil_GK11636 [Drosophila willistoni]